MRKCCVKNIGLLVLTVFAIVLWQAGVSVAQTREITATGEYVMGDGETMAVSEERARNNAIRLVAEEAGVFIKSYTKVRNMAVEQDEVEMIANHAMKVTVLEKKRFMEGNAVRFVVTVKAVISEADIAANLKQAATDRKMIDEHKRLREEFARQDRELEELKKRLARATADQQKEVLRKIEENENQFRAALLLEQATTQIAALNFSGAENSLTRAIALNPKLAQAYAARAESRIYMADKATLLADVNRAIELEPERAMYYAIRARINAFKNNCSVSNPQGCDDAFKDIGKACSLEPANPTYLMMSGALYASLNQFERAAVQYDKAVSIMPSKTLPMVAVHAYLQRAEFRLEEAAEGYLARAVDDLNRAVSIVTSPAYMSEDVKKVAALLKHKPQSEQEVTRLLKEIWGIDMTGMSEKERNDFKAGLGERFKTARDVLRNAAIVYWKRSEILYETGDAAAAEKDRAVLCAWTEREELTYPSGIIADADVCSPRGIYRPFDSPRKLEAYQLSKRGQRLYARNRPAEAIGILSRALVLDNTITFAWMTRAYAHMQITPPAFDKAVGDFTAALRLEPKNSRILYERGMAFWAGSNERQFAKDEQGAKKGRLMAEKDFSEVLRLKNDEIHMSMALVQRARVYRMEGMYEEAARDYLDAARNYGNFQMYKEAAGVLEAARKFDDAERALDEYIAYLQEQIDIMGEEADPDLTQLIAHAQQERQRIKENVRPR